MSGRWIVKRGRHGSDDMLGYELAVASGGTIRLEVPLKLTRLDAERVGALAASVAEGVGPWAFPLARVFSDGKADA